MADKLLSAENIPLITVVIGVGVVSLLLARACGKSSSAPSQTVASEQQPPTEDKAKAKKKKKKKKASTTQETSDEEEQEVKVTKKDDKKGAVPTVQAVPEAEEKKLSKGQARRKRAKAKKVGDEQRKVEQVEKDKQLAAAKRAQEKATQQRVEKLIQQQKKADADGFMAAPTRRNAGRVLRPSKENEHLSLRKDAKEPEPIRETTSITIAIPTKSLGFIIGKEGKTIKEIQQRTATQILTPKEKKSDGTPEVPIKITGDAEGVALAKQAINDLLSKGFSSVVDPATASGTVFLENEKQIGILIGPKGSVIQKFQKTLGVNIKMPSPGDRKLAVVISGPKEAVKEARQSMKDLLELGYSKILDPTWTHIEVPFPPAALGRLIGVRGQNLKSIQGNTGCRVNIPKAGSDKKDSVIIVGPVSKMESAKKQVLRWAEEQQEAPAVDPYDPWGEDEEENYDNEW